MHNPNILLGHNAHAHFPQENGRLFVWPLAEGVLDLCNGAVSEKLPQIVRPPLPAEYVTAFSGRTDAPEPDTQLL